jgi:hypothetical protein
MLRKKSFIWSMERGGGWKPEDQPEFNAGGPVIVAHDTIEHLNSSTKFEHELIAFGSILYGRAYLDRGMVDVMSDDLTKFLLEQDMKVAKPRDRWSKPLHDMHAEGALQAVLLTVKLQLMLSVMTGRIDSADAVYDTLDHRVAPWMRLGFLLNERRYKGHTHEQVYAAFKHVFDETIDDHEAELPQIGDRLVVTFNTKTLRTHVERDRSHRQHEETTS